MGSTRRLEGKPVAEALLEGARRRVDDGTRRGLRPPALVSVHRAGDTPFAFYLRQQAKGAERAGVTFRDEVLPRATEAAGVRSRLAALDADPTVDAVLLEHPLPTELGFRTAIEALRPPKDVDGVSHGNLGRLVEGHPVHAPAVALAALAILTHYKVPLSGRRVAVVGRSETVGLPLALLLSARGGADATVTVAHSRTSELRGALAGSEVVFGCAGHPGLLDRKVVPEGATVVDIGLTSVADPSRPGGQRAVGDADEASLDGWASALTPVPGGVGPVTVAQLMVNAVRAWELLHPEDLR